MATSSKIAYCLNMNTNHCHKKLKQFPGRIYKIKFTLRSGTLLFTLFSHLLNQAIFLAFSCINFSHYEFNNECLSSICCYKFLFKPYFSFSKISFPKPIDFHFGEGSRFLFLPFFFCFVVFCVFNLFILLKSKTV